MNDRRIEPRTRCARYGLNELRTPSRKIVFVTHSGLQIGIRYTPAPVRDIGVHAEYVQEMMLHRRPLALDQVYVAAMCTQERRT